MLDWGFGLNNIISVLLAFNDFFFFFFFFFVVSSHD